MLRIEGMVPAVLVLLAMSLAPGASAQEQKEPSGTVEIDQTQMAFLISGQLGGGVLHYQGKSYEFSIGGLGVGGIGISEIEAKGNVYDLNDVADFAGVYGQARTGFALGAESGGGLVLENTKGVHMTLDAKREGIMLSLGADGIVVTMKE